MVCEGLLCKPAKWVARVAVCRASSRVDALSEAWSRKGRCSNSVSVRSSASDLAASSSMDPAAADMKLMVPWMLLCEHDLVHGRCQVLLTVQHGHLRIQAAQVLKTMPATQT